MGKMKIWWVLGFERWGGLKPFEMWEPDGKCFRPLVFGIWIRHPKSDRHTHSQQTKKGASHEG